jgi:glutamyl-tRNA synthetase
MNGVYIRQLPLDELTRRTLPYLERPEAAGGLPDTVKRPLDPEYTKRVLHLEQERLKTLADAPTKDALFYVDTLNYDSALLIQKGMDKGSTRSVLTKVLTLLTGLEQWEHAPMETRMNELAVELGLKKGPLFGSVRVAVSGSIATPPLFQMMEVLGRDVCMQRIEQAIERLA